MRKLRFWNGMGDDGEPDGDLYLCAASQQKALNLIHRTAYRRITFATLDKCRADCWGNAMKGIAAKPGVWIVRKDGDKPERLT